MVFGAVICVLSGLGILFSLKLTKGLNTGFPRFLVLII